MKIIIFDIDNTITKTKGMKYENSTPIKSKIKIINQLFDKGHIVKIFTSRYMGKHKGNVNVIKKKILQKNKSTIKELGIKISRFNFWKTNI